MADELDDGLDYAFENSFAGESISGQALLSDGEEPQVASGEDEGAFYDNDSEGEGEALVNQDSKKRKAQDEDANSNGSAKKSKKEKKKKNEKFTEKKQVKQQSFTEQRRNLAASSSFIIADYLSSKVKHRYPDLSTIELGDMYIKEANIESTEDFEEERELENYGDFIKKYFASLLKELPQQNQKDKASNGKKEKNPKNGNAKSDSKSNTDTPPRYIVVLAASALRVCDINRALRDSPFGSFKLIKKNKLSYDVHMFETGKSRIAVATVGRLEKILELKPLQIPSESGKAKNGKNEKNEKKEKKENEENKKDVKNEERKKPLNYNQIAGIVVDSTFLDKKEQHTWDLKETIPFVKKIIEECEQLEGEDSDKLPKVYLY